MQNKEKLFIFSFLLPNTEAQVIRTSLSLNTEQHFSFEQPSSSTNSTAHVVSVLFQSQLVQTKLFYFNQSFQSNHSILINAFERRRWQCTGRDKQTHLCLVSFMLVCVLERQKELEMFLHMQMCMCERACLLSAIE